jgi:enoyl-[acyl-carrier protein] reductase III
MWIHQASREGATKNQFKMKKYALIIGGSSGMGLASAKKLGKEGHNIFIVHRDRRSVLAAFEAEVAALKGTGVDVFTYNVDGISPEKVQQTCQAFLETVTDLHFSVVLHAISRGNLKSFVSDDQPELTQEDLMLTIDAMAVNVLTWVQTLRKNNLIRANSRIITLTSAGSQKYWSGYGAVALAKASLEILTKYLAIELAKFNMRANVINAGITDTPSLQLIPGYDLLVANATANNPLGRMTTPEDVANVVYLLSTPEANWINGTIINVDGGETLVQ